MNHHPSFAITPYLQKLPLFSDMQPSELARLTEGCIVRRAARGEMLFRVGDPCDEFHAVIRGQVKLFALAPNGQEKVIDLVSPGQTFGEALMFTNQPYIVHVQALTETTLLTVQRQAILRELEADHRFALRMLAGISRKMHTLIHDVESYALRSGTQRVIAYLLHSEATVSPTDNGEHPVGRTVTLPVSKATLASRLSLTPEYFSRVLHDLAEQGLIEVDRRHIHISDTERLLQYQMQSA